MIVSRTFRGDGDKPSLDVYRWEYGRGPGQFSEGATILVFLQRRQDGVGADTPNSYQMVYGPSSCKRLSPADLASYLQKLEELQALLGNPDSNATDTTEWLVRCAEDPVTRREGAFELYQSALREQWQQEEPAREGPRARFWIRARKMPRDEEPPFAALLTTGQKDRLMDALLKCEVIGEGDFDLIGLASRLKEPRLLPLLISYLHRFEQTAPPVLAQVMQQIAELLGDEKLTAFFRNYRDNATYEELEAPSLNVATADQEDEEADSNDGEVDDEDETISSEEPADPPKLTPEAAIKARVEMLKKFLDLAEAKILAQSR